MLVDLIRNAQSTMSYARSSGPSNVTNSKALSSSVQNSLPSKRKNPFSSPDSRHELSNEAYHPSSKSKRKAKLIESGFESGYEQEEENYDDSGFADATCADPSIARTESVVSQLSSLANSSDVVSTSHLFVNSEWLNIMIGKWRIAQHQIRT